MHMHLWHSSVICAGPVSLASAATLQANAGYMPNGSLQDTAWQYVTHRSPNVSLQGSDWFVDNLSFYPNDVTTSSQANAAMMFSFSGTEVRHHMLLVRIPQCQKT